MNKNSKILNDSIANSATSIFNKNYSSIHSSRNEKSANKVPEEKHEESNPKETSYGLSILKLIIFGYLILLLLSYIAVTLSPIVIYTDASCGATSIGIGIFFGDNHPLNRSKKVELPGRNNVLGETLAVTMALHLLYTWDDYNGERVVVKTDCQNIIKALRKCKREIYENLKGLAEMFPNGVEFQWVEGHSGIYGNVMANNLAREAIGKEAEVWNEGASTCTSFFDWFFDDSTKDRKTNVVIKPSNCQPWDPNDRPDIKFHHPDQQIVSITLDANKYAIDVKSIFEIV